MTTAELEDAVLTYYLNQGSSSVVSDPALRKKAWFGTTKVGKRIWNAAPHWFRVADGSVVLTAGVGTMPTNFSHFGTQGQLWVSGSNYQTVTYRTIDEVKAMIQTNAQTGQPQIYSLFDQSSAGVPKILCWPQDNSTLLAKAYVKKMPELIDVPPAPTATATATVGLPTGSYNYVVTNVTASGETEGSPVSNTVAPALKQISLLIPKTEQYRTITSRKVYRTAAGGYQHKLVTTLAIATAPAHLDYTYTDNTADGALGADVPLLGASVSGLEVFPEQFHESALYDGVVAWLAGNQGDGREADFWSKWDRSVARLWQEIKQGQNIAQAFPPFPGFIEGHPMWSKFSPP